MPVALSTTKRKFHKILDSISNASNTALVPQSDTKSNASTTTLQSPLESPAKKPRIVRPVSAFVTATKPVSKPQPRASSSSSTPRIESSMPVVIHPQDPPNFAPWDKTQFLKRLESFRHVDKWHGKPEKINEVHWAKRGWSCVGRDTVRCVGGCSKELVIKLENDLRQQPPKPEETEAEEQGNEDEWRERAQEQLVETYADRVVSGHAISCLWRRRGCDDVIFRLPLYHQGNAISGLRQRYKSLLPMSAELPTNLSTPPTFEMSKLHPEITSLLRETDTYSGPETRTSDPSHPPSPTRTPPDPPVNREALILALYGWQAETGHIAGLATCSSCFRRLGLWLFRTRISPTGEEKEATMARLDVIGEHRDYCPWINALSQNGPPSRPSTSSEEAPPQDKAGWELLYRIVLNAVRAKRREEVPRPPATPQEDDISVTSTFATGTTAVERASREEKDKQRWAKLKKLKQSFTIKKGKKKENIAPA